MKSNWRKRPYFLNPIWDNKKKQRKWKKTKIPDGSFYPTNKDMIEEEDSWKENKPSVRNIIKEVNKIKPKIKYYDKGLDVFTKALGLDGFGESLCINAFMNPNHYKGNWYIIKSILIRGLISVDWEERLTEYYRIILAYDRYPKETDGPVHPDELENTPITDVLRQDVITSNINTEVENSGRFIILWDKTIVVPFAPGEYRNNVIIPKFYKKTNLRSDAHTESYGGDYHKCGQGALFIWLGSLNADEECGLRLEVKLGIYDG